MNIFFAGFLLGFIMFNVGFYFCWFFHRKIITQDWDVTNLVVNEYEGEDLGEKMNNAFSHLPKIGGRLSVRKGAYTTEKTITLSGNITVSGVHVEEKLPDNITLKDTHLS